MCVCVCVIPLLFLFFASGDCFVGLWVGSGCLGVWVSGWEEGRRGGRRDCVCFCGEEGGRGERGEGEGAYIYI